ncbi:MAG: Leupeptin-inactivating enzyme 1 precursor [Planctomycetota bacterium]|jgi:hypothetical protein
MPATARNLFVCVLALATSTTATLAQGTGTEAATGGDATAAPLPEGAPPRMARIDRTDLRTHAMWLADDARRGRLTGSKGQQEAAKYVADHFRSLGLKPLGDKKGFLQNYPLEKVALDPATSITFGTVKLTTGLAVFPSSDTDRLTLSGRFAFCGTGRPDEMPQALKGRIPVVALRTPPRGQGTVADFGALQRIADIAREAAGREAAVVVVALLDDQGAFANAINYGALQPEHPVLRFGGEGRASQRPRVPVLVLNTASGARLLEHLQVTLGEDGKPVAPAQEKATGKLSLAVKVDPKAMASNVVAVLEGTDLAREAVVYSAHMDHVGVRIDGDPFNGADDNASGTSGLLEIAQAYADGEPPSRSVVFLAVSGEELGLWGSAWFADHPTWPADRIVANVNIDMIGRAVVKDDRIQMQVTPSHAHEKYSTIVRDGVAMAGRLRIDLTSGDTYYQRSDHYNFAKKGIPVVFFCDGEHPDYHQVTDHPDKLDYASMEAVARLAFWTGWEVANRRERPRELGPQPGW